jgi:hypothetical protein
MLKKRRKFFKQLQRKIGENRRICAYNAHIGCGYSSYVYSGRQHYQPQLSTALHHINETSPAQLQNLLVVGGVL